MKAPSLRGTRLRYGALLALAVLDALVPSVAAPQNVLGALGPHVGVWIAVHLLQIPVLALVAVMLWPLFDAIPGRWAIVGRIGLACCALAWVAVVAAQALGFGVLVDYAGAQSGASQTVLAAAVDALWLSRPLAAVATLGNLGWLVALLALAQGRARSLLAESLVPLVVVLGLAVGFSGMVEGRANPPFIVGTLTVAILLAGLAQPRLPLALLALAAICGSAGPTPGLGAIGALLLLAALLLQEVAVVDALPAAVRPLFVLPPSEPSAARTAGPSPARTTTTRAAERSPRAPRTASANPGKRHTRDGR